MNEKLIVIGLVGRKRTGKDTIANILSTFAGFKRISLADGIKSAISDLDGPTKEISKYVDENEITNRKLWQFLGTECRQIAEAPNLWLELAIAKIAFLVNLGISNRIVVPDIRYPHEAEVLLDFVKIRNYGIFQLWKVNRELKYKEVDNHSSETQVDSINVGASILNNGTIEELSNLVMKLISHIIPPEKAQQESDKLLEHILEQKPILKPT